MRVKASNLVLGLFFAMYGGLGIEWRFKMEDRGRELVCEVVEVV